MYQKEVIAKSTGDKIQDVLTTTDLPIHCNYICIHMRQAGTLRALIIIITATITERALTTFPAHQYRTVMMLLHKKTIRVL